MKLYFLVKSAITAVALCGLGLAVGIFTFRAQASQWDKQTVITLDQPIQVTDTYLEPGTYVFRVLDSASDRHVVQIFNASQDHLINTVMAFPNYRLQPTGGSQFTFWETPPGTAKAMRAWFYPGDGFGQEFRYPKQLRQLAVLRAPTPAPVPAPPPAAVEPQTPAPPPPPPTPEPAPQALNQQPPQSEQPVEIAQNNPPPPPAEPAPPQELPTTASPYPLIGLGGLLSLGAYGLVLLKRFV